MSIDERPPLPGNVAGRCPACGGESLFLGAGGHVTCSRLDCPRPDAADLILGDGETCHVVEYHAGGSTVRHPLIERVDGDRFDCELGRQIQSMPPGSPGRYRVVEDTAGDWVFQTIARATSSTPPAKPRPTPKVGHGTHTRPTSTGSPESMETPMPEIHPAVAAVLARMPVDPDDGATLVGFRPQDGVSWSEWGAAEPLAATYAATAAIWAATQCEDEAARPGKSPDRADELLRMATWFRDEADGIKRPGLVEGSDADA